MKRFLTKKWASRLERGFWLLLPLWAQPKYHSYSVFGVKYNPQLSEAYVKNQKTKFPIITAYIAYALAKCKKTIDDPASFAEYFCADGYFTMLARHLGASEAHGYDNGKDPFFRTAGKMSKRLGLTNVYFHKADIFSIDEENSVDIVANIGGLYHVPDPAKAIDISYRHCRKYMILQTVVSMENNAPDYFETPAPGWSWGCRFSRAWLDQLVADKGYKVIDSHFNELEGNEALGSRGSSYYLIEKT